MQTLLDIISEQIQNCDNMDQVKLYLKIFKEITAKQIEQLTQLAEQRVEEIFDQQWEEARLQEIIDLTQI